jgi:hypothetical protein
MVELIMGHQNKTIKVTDSIIVRKEKWLFMNGCEYKSPVSTVTEFLNSCHDWKSLSTVWRLHPKIMTLLGKK